MNQNKYNSNLKFWNKKCEKCQKSLPYLECNPSFFCYFVNKKDTHYCDDCLPEEFIEIRMGRMHWNCNCKKYNKYGACHDLFESSVGKSGRFYWDNGTPKNQCYTCGGGRLLGKNGDEIIECENCDRKFCGCTCKSHAPKCDGKKDGKNYNLTAKHDHNANKPENITDKPPLIENDNNSKENKKNSEVENKPSKELPENDDKNRAKEVKIVVDREKGNNQNNSSNSGEKLSDNKGKGEVLVIDLKNVKQINLTSGGKLIIEFNSSENNNYTIQTMTTEQINGNQELQTIKNYCQKNGKSSLSQSELNGIFNANKTDTQARRASPTDNDNKLTIGLSITAALIVGLAIGLLLKKKKVKRS